MNAAENNPQGLAFQRVYVDIPPDTNTRLAARARELGMSKKALLAALIERECGGSKSKTSKRK